MDFRSRGIQSPTTPTGNSSSSSTSSVNNNRFDKQKFGKWLERGSFLLLIAITIIVLAIAALTFLSGNGQAGAIKKDKYQAVFLNNGQVYFGNIKDLNSKYINLRNIYYLQTANAAAENTEESSSNVSLVKLGCELHAPYDQMLINAEQVIFWENLQDDSQVVKAIAQYKKDNPNGQKCSTESQSSTQQAPSTNTQQSTSPTSNNSNDRRP